jgi:transcriptional regulator with XRE-family HTH domain
VKIPRLREWREAMGETQLTLAERSGVAEHTISRIEQGYGARPNTAKKLADALDVSVMDLMESPPVLAGKAEAPEAGPPAFEAGDVVASIPYDESTPSEAIGDAVAAAFKEARGRVPDGVGRPRPRAGLALRRGVLLLLRFRHPLPGPHALQGVGVRFPRLRRRGSVDDREDPPVRGGDFSNRVEFLCALVLTSYTVEDETSTETGDNG